MTRSVDVVALRSSGAAVLGVAAAIALPILLGIGALSLLSSSGYVESIVCYYELDAPCPGTGSLMELAGYVALACGIVAVGISLRYLLRSGRIRLLAPALSLLFTALFAIAAVTGPSLGNAIVELGALAAATGVLSFRIDRSRLLLAAVGAQAADLATFGAVWQLGSGEINPLGRLAVDALTALGLGGAEDGWAAAALAGLLLIGAKLVLIGFLIRVAPYLGRYRGPVLATAAVVGAVGAAVNAIAL